jgi:hypothetical protein
MNKDNLIKYVLHLLKECCKEGWDGYSADPLKDETALRFIKLVNKLPDGLLGSTGDCVGPCPDGSLDLEFQCASPRGGVFLTIAPDNDKIEFSWFVDYDIGIEQTENFSLDEDVPQHIIEKIKELRTTSEKD